VWNSHSNPNGYLYWNCKALSPNQNEQTANGILANNNSRSIYNSALLYKKLINIHTFSSVHTSSSHLQTYLLCKIYCQNCLLTNDVEITKKLVNSSEAVKAFTKSKWTICQRLSWLSRLTFWQCQDQESRLRHKTNCNP
jgi:hypothetical protein